VSGLVHEDIHIVDDVEHGDVSVPVIGMASSWVWESNDVTDPLACEDREFAEAIDEVLERAWAILMPTDDPCFTALLFVSKASSYE
jgi:hypothetical protein